MYCDGECLLITQEMVLQACLCMMVLIVLWWQDPLWVAPFPGWDPGLCIHLFPVPNYGCNTTCWFNFPTMMDCTPELWAEINPFSLSCSCGSVSLIATWRVTKIYTFEFRDHNKPATGASTNTHVSHSRHEEVGCSGPFSNSLHSIGCCLAHLNTNYLDIPNLISIGWTP